MIYFTADTHANLDIAKFNKISDIIKKDDMIVVCGDFGLPGFNRDTDRFLMEYYTRLGCTIVFIDGNHEHFDKLRNYKIEEWNGGKVQFITKNVIHLMRGEIYNIDGLDILTCGGAYSIDKYRRIPHVTWFDDEELSLLEYENMMNNLGTYKNKVDIVLTHTPPQSIIKEVFSENSIHDNTAFALEGIKNTIKYKKWLSGHLHVDRVCNDNRHVLLYNNILSLSDLCID